MDSKSASNLPRTAVLVGGLGLLALIVAGTAGFRALRSASLCGTSLSIAGKRGGHRRLRRFRAVAAFQRVDFEYVLKVGALAQRLGALGYLRTKGRWGGVDRIGTASVAYCLALAAGGQFKMQRF